MAGDGSGSRGSGSGRSSSKPGHFDEALGRAIKVLRTAHGLGRRELAESASLSYSYLTEIENGTKQASSRILHTIAETLGVPVSDLIQAAEAWDSDSIRPVEGTSALGNLALTTVATADTLEENPPSLMRQLERWPKRRRHRLGRRRGSDAQPDPGGSPSKELQRRFEGLSEEDQERVLDLVRRLGDDES